MAGPLSCGQCLTWTTTPNSIFCACSTVTAAGTPETIVGSREVLAKLVELAAGDADEESVLLSWAEGLSGKEAADSAGINMKEYDAARKRLNRKIAAVKKLTGQ